MLLMAKLAKQRAERGQTAKQLQASEEAWDRLEKAWVEAESERSKSAAGAEALQAELAGERNKRKQVEGELAGERTKLRRVVEELAGEVCKRRWVESERDAAVEEQHNAVACSLELGLELEEDRRGDGGERQRAEGERDRALARVESLEHYAAKVKAAVLDEGIGPKHV